MLHPKTILRLLKKRTESEVNGTDRSFGLVPSQQCTAPQPVYAYFRPSFFHFKKMALRSAGA